MRTFDPGPLANVDYRSSGERWTLVFVRELKHAPEKVWATLTEQYAKTLDIPVATDHAEDASSK